MPVDARRPARQPALREHNLGLVLAEIVRRGPVSRAGVAAGTGLTKASVSSLVEVLAAAGLVTEGGPAGAGAVGRPGRPLAPSARGPVGIGLEVNVDYVATCTVDLAGTVTGHEVVVHDLRADGGPDPAGAIGRAVPVLRRALDRAAAGGRPVAGVGIAVPGLVETGTEILRVAPNLGWRDVPVLDLLRTAGVPAELPLRLDNEANLAALGELWCGGHPGADSFVYVSGEIGVGAAIVVEGRLFRGLHGFSGEIGHLPVAGAGDGAPCACGARGCLEQVVGQEALLRAAGLPGGDPAQLAVRAAQDDPRVLAAVRDAGAALGTAVTAIVNLVDVGTIVLGGIYAALAPWLAGPVTEVAGRRVLGAPWQPVRVLASRLGRDAAVRGAATVIVQEVVADPAAYLARTGA